MDKTINRRLRNSQGYGGVCTYVRNDLISFEVKDCVNDPKVEQVWCQVNAINEEMLN